MILSQHMNSSGYVDLSRLEIMEHMAPQFSKKGREQIEFAYATSKYGHRPQERADGNRYFDHPKTVAWLLFERYRVFSWKAIVIALLHDVLEDSFILSESRIELNCGKEVSWSVVVISKNTFTKKLLGDDDAPYYRRIVEQGSWRCKMVKVTDRIHNLSTLSGLELERQARKIDETLRFFPGIIKALAEEAPEAYLPSVEMMRSDLETLCNEWADQTGNERPNEFSFELSA